MEEETKLETPEEKAHRKERERFMRQAITQAKKAEKLMEVPIGCVIVYEGKVIARGYSDCTDVSWKGWRSDSCLCCDAGEKERTCKNAAGKNKCRIRREEEKR